MVPAVLHRVCYGTSYPGKASSLSFSHAILHKHRRHKVRFCDYPAVIPSSSSSSSSVRGTYVRGLTDGDIRRLDIYEGDEYVRKVVKIRTLAQAWDDDAGIGNVEEEAEEEVETETYLWIAGEDALEESDWDFDEFKKDKLRSWLMLDGHYAGGLCHLANNHTTCFVCTRSDNNTFKRLMRPHRLAILIRLKDMVQINLRRQMFRIIRTNEKTIARPSGRFMIMYICP